MKFKRLAVVVDTFPRWSERFIARELSELRRRGAQFTVFCLKAGTEPAETDREWSELVSRRVVLPSCFLPSVSKGGPRYNLARKALGALYRPLGCVSSLVKLLSDGGFQHIHAHFASLPSTLAWLAAGETGIPFSFSVHARDLFVEPQLLEEKLADCVRVFACHGKAANFLTRRADAKLVHMHHGLPLEHFPFAEAAPRKESPEFLAAGRFVPKKGFHRAIEAMNDARLLARRARLTLVGEGPELRNYKKLVKTLMLYDQVEFVPPASGDKLRVMLRRSSALLAPFENAADGDADGIPNIILEAFALGAPVIGSAAGSLSEVLTDQTGIVVSEASTLADAMAGFIDRPPLKQTHAARRLVEKDFDIRKNIEPMVRMLNE